MEVKILVTTRIVLHDDLPDFADGDPGEDRMKESAREAVQNALEFVRDEVGFNHDMDSVTSLEEFDCEIAPDVCAQCAESRQLAENAMHTLDLTREKDAEIERLKDELDRALNREAAIRIFCEAEMGWEYFRAETKISDNPSQSMLNADKLRKYLADNQEDTKTVAARKELLDTLVDAEKMLNGILREVTLHGEWEGGVSRLIDKCREVISKTTQV